MSKGITAQEMDAKTAAGLIPHLGTTTNSGNAYSITTSEEVKPNTKFTVKINSASTGAATLKINDNAAAPIKDQDGKEAKLKASVYTLFWDSTNFTTISGGGGGELDGPRNLADYSAYGTIGSSDRWIWDGDNMIRSSAFVSYDTNTVSMKRSVLDKSGTVLSTVTTSFAKNSSQEFVYKSVSTKFRTYVLLVTFTNPGTKQRLAHVLSSGTVEMIQDTYHYWLGDVIETMSGQPLIIGTYMAEASSVRTEIVNRSQTVVYQLTWALSGIPVQGDIGHFFITDQLAHITNPSGQSDMAHVDPVSGIWTGYNFTRGSMAPIQIIAAYAKRTKY